MNIAMIQQAMPKAPPDLADEVELFARESGRTGTLHFIPVGGWFARLSLRCDDPRLKMYQDGDAEEPPVEDVWFHLPKPGTLDDYECLNIIEMGRLGVREFLERGDTWSGRGEFKDHMEALLQARDNNEAVKVSFREEQKVASREEQRDKRRHRFGVLSLPVGANLETSKEV